MLSLIATGANVFAARLSTSVLSGPSLYFTLRVRSSRKLFITVELLMMVV